MRNLKDFKVLVLASVFPYPADKGEKIRTYQMIESTAKCFTVDLITFLESRSLEDKIEEFKELCSIRQIDTVQMGKSRILINIIKGFISKDPVIIKSYEDRRMRRLIMRAAKKEYDAILFCGPRMALYRNELRNYKCIIDYVDALTMNMKREMYYQKNIARRIYIRLNIKKMREFEQSVKAFFTKSIIISDVDKAWLGLNDIDCTTIPICVDTDYFSYIERKCEIERTIVFLGNMYYYPNQDAVSYFLEEIWEKVLNQIPDAKLTIIGPISKRKHDCFQAVRNVSVKGYVKDIREHLREAKLMIVPLRAGSGLASKILQSLAVGVPVVCTSRANEGIWGNKEVGVFVEDNERAFADAIVELLNNYSEYEETRLKGRKFIETNFSMMKHEKMLREAILALLG